MIISFDNILEASENISLLQWKKIIINIWKLKKIDLYWLRTQTGKVLCQIFCKIQYFIILSSKFESQ